MLFKLNALFTALVATAVSAVTIPTMSISKFDLKPFDLGINYASIKSAVSMGASAESTLADATLVLCSVSQCSGSCFRFQVANLPYRQCYSSNDLPSFSSVYLANPSASAVPFSVAVGNCSSEMAEIPRSGTCYNVTPPGIHFARVEGTTPV